MPVLLTTVDVTISVQVQQLVGDVAVTLAIGWIQTEKHVLVRSK